MANEERFECVPTSSGPYPSLSRPRSDTACRMSLRISELVMLEKRCVFSS